MGYTSPADKMFTLTGIKPWCKTREKDLTNSAKKEQCHLKGK